MRDEQKGTRAREALIWKRLAILKGVRPAGNSRPLDAHSLVVTTRVVALIRSACRSAPVFWPSPGYCNAWMKVLGASRSGRAQTHRLTVVRDEMRQKKLADQRTKRCIASQEARCHGKATVEGIRTRLLPELPAFRLVETDQAPLETGSRNR